MQCYFDCQCRERYDCWYGFSRAHNSKFFTPDVSSKPFERLFLWFIITATNKEKEITLTIQTVSLHTYVALFHHHYIVWMERNLIDRAWVTDDVEFEKIWNILKFLISLKVIPFIIFILVHAAASIVFFLHSVKSNIV